MTQASERPALFQTTERQNHRSRMTKAGPGTSHSNRRFQGRRGAGMPPLCPEIRRREVAGFPRLRARGRGRFGRLARLRRSGCRTPGTCSRFPTGRHVGQWESPDRSEQSTLRRKFFPKTHKSRFRFGLKLAYGPAEPTTRLLPSSCPISKTKSVSLTTALPSLLPPRKTACASSST